MIILKTLGLFVVTALAEIVGCYLPYLWLKKDGSPWLLVVAAVSLALFVWLLSLHPAAASIAHGLGFGGCRRNFGRYGHHRLGRMAGLSWVESRSIGLSAPAGRAHLNSAPDCAMICTEE